jgi:hypothetical protein
MRTARNPARSLMRLIFLCAIAMPISPGQEVPGDYQLVSESDRKIRRLQSECSETGGVERAARRQPTRPRRLLIRIFRTALAK